MFSSFPLLPIRRPAAPASSAATPRSASRRLLTLLAGGAPLLDRPGGGVISESIGSVGLVSGMLARVPATGTVGSGARGGEGRSTGLSAWHPQPRRCARACGCAVIQPRLAQPDPSHRPTDSGRRDPWPWLGDHFFHFRGHFGSQAADRRNWSHHVGVQLGRVVVARKGAKFPVSAW